MRRATTAVLLSALVLPGAGHLYLRKFWRGAVLIALSLAALSIIVTQAVQQASVVLDQLLTNGGPIDMGHVTALATQASNQSGGGASTLAILGLAACWVAGIIDSYRLGKKLDTAT